jgi:hypothetical protein
VDAAAERRCRCCDGRKLSAAGAFERRVTYLLVSRVDLTDCLNKLVGRIAL